MQPTPPPNGPQYRGGGFAPAGPLGPAPGYPPTGPPGYPPLCYPPLGQPTPPPSYPPLGQPGYPPTGAPGHPPPPGPGYPPPGAPGYPPAGYPGYPPGPFGHPQPPQPPKSPAGRRLAVAAAAVLVVVLVAGVSAFWLHRRSGATGPTASTKPDITALYEALLLDRDRFSGFDGDNWYSGIDAPDSAAGNHDGGTDQTFDPEECRRLGAPDETQTGGSSLSGSDGGDYFDTVSLLSLTAQRFDPTEYLDRCARYTSTFADQGGTSTMVTTTKRVSPSGLPGWAIAYTTTIADDPPGDGPGALYTRVLTVQGYYRGILVSAIRHVMYHGKRPTDGDAYDDKLVALFNAQVARLEDAP